MKKIFQKTTQIMPNLPIREWVEKRIQFAIAESVAQAHHESKQQLSEFGSEIQAALQGFISELPDKAYVERRVKLSVLEMQGFFDQNVEAVSANLRALGKAISELQQNFQASSRKIEKTQDEITGHNETLEKINMHLHAISKVFSELKQDLQDKTSEIPKIHNDISKKYHELEENLQKLSSRLEFVRMETLYEVQAKLHKTDHSAVAPKIINQAKLDAMKPDGIRLNVGCGHIPLDGYLNIDGRELPGIDIVCDANSIPFENGSIKEILSAHLVEHFSCNILKSVILPHWFNLLETGGTLVTVAPDGGAMLEAVNAGTMSYDDFREVLFGGQEYDNDFHYNMLTVDSFSALLNHVGFSDVKLEYSGKRNGKCFEFRVTARKP